MICDVILSPCPCLQLKAKDVLSKYDEEISGPKKGESFELGSKGSYNTSQEQRMDEIRKELQKGAQTLCKYSGRAEMETKPLVRMCI